MQIQQVIGLINAIKPLIPIIKMLIQQKGGNTEGMSNADMAITFAQDVIPAYEQGFSFDGKGRYHGPYHNLDPATIALIISSVAAIASFFSNLIKANKKGQLEEGSTLKKAADIAEGTSGAIDEARAQARAAKFFGSFFQGIQQNLGIITLVTIGALTVYIFARES